MVVSTSHSPTKSCRQEQKKWKRIPLILPEFLLCPARDWNALKLVKVKTGDFLIAISEEQREPSAFPRPWH